MVGDELLSAESAKNVYNKLKKGENSEAKVECKTTQDWDDITPEIYRKRVEDEKRRCRDIEDLYLPPCRKTLQQIR